MVSRIQNPIASQVRAPSAPKAPAAAVAVATPNAAETKAGWGPKGAGAAQKLAAAQGSQVGQVKLLKATIDEGPSAKGFPAPRGVEVKIGADKRTDSVALSNGKTAKLTWDSSTLSVKNAKTGKTTELVGRDDKYFKEFQSNFQEGFKAMTKEDLQYAGDEPGYDASRGFSGAGSAGKLLSVSEGSGEFAGGAHPNSGTSLMTFDTATGKQVRLDALLSKEQFASIVKQVSAGIPNLTGEDITDGTAFSIYGDAKDHVANNFSLSTDKKGNVQIDVAWESGVHALGGQMAHFTFAAPTDAAFKQKLGLE